MFDTKHGSKRTKYGVFQFKIRHSVYRLKSFRKKCGKNTDLYFFDFTQCHVKVQTLACVILISVKHVKKAKITI